MAHAYTPGLQVTDRIRHRVRRLLPLSGDVRVSKGDLVSAQDIVADTQLPGDVTPVNLAKKLSVPPSDVPDLLLCSEGDTLKSGQPIGRTKGVFGLFKTEYKSPVGGTLETVSKVTGQLMIRAEPTHVQIRAYMSGTIAEVIPNEGVVVEADVAFIQGIFGIGGEAYGPIRLACGDPADELGESAITTDMQGQVVVGGARMTGAAVRKAIEVGASAVISGGMDDQDLRETLGYDLGVAITGSERIGTTIVITEGFGDIAMADKTFALLTSHAGSDASVNGATQIRAGVMRPEILIPLTADQLSTVAEPEHTAGLLEPGTPVRMIRDPYFGRIGTVASLPSEPQTLESESKARVLTVRTSDGLELTIPRANVETIST